MRTSKHFLLDNPQQFKEKLLLWSQPFEELVWLDSNTHQNKQEKSYNSFDALLAVDALTAFKTDTHKAFDQFDDYFKTTNDWIFGYLTYDLKNDLEHLSSKNVDGLQFPAIYFFQPKKIFIIKKNKLAMHYLHFIADEMDADFNAIKNAQTQMPKSSFTKLNLMPRIQKQNYLEKIHKIKNHIQLGDIYEANFCMEFFAQQAHINPLEIYNKLNSISSAPFASFIKMEAYFLISASPERYLKKEGSKIISQPIKGTAKREKDTLKDNAVAKALTSNEKERSENIMIADLVRNDLSRTATRGSVQVEELCGLYTFKQVHQLITTVVSQVEKNTSIIDVLKTTFPMGSMTGAPKQRAMQIIEALEETKRGLYSGAVGYISPQGNADFSVVIRSILYNQLSNYLSCSVGSAITIKSIPEMEYEECLLKAKAMLEVLEN